MADAEGDDSLDEDDMMDKISSSPSIDDGGYSPERTWPSFTTSSSNYSLADDASAVSSSPYTERPAFLPSVPFFVEPSFAHRLGNSHLQVSVNSLTAITSVWEEEESFENSDPDRVEAYDDDYDSYNSDDVFAVRTEESGHSDSSEVGSDDSYDDDLCFPCESSDEGDDEFPFPEDPRFIDSGWGGECLQDTEDIDFEFVYALHTFVATVEGQANATKGDTMVLLDDSNSYWWLVRVVKDSSIGEFGGIFLGMQFLTNI
jgi:hypothetical protein